jgi:hypothetical protein
MIVSNLTALATEILSGQGDIDKSILLLNQYCEDLSRWYEQNEARLRAGNLAPGEEEALAELDRLHGRVLEFGAGLQSRCSADLIDFRRKARGIMAYTDTLPKRISIARKRQG